MRGWHVPLVAIFLVLVSVASCGGADEPSAADTQPTNEPASSEPGGVNPEAAIAEIRETFSAYTQAVVDQNGKAAVALIAADTLDYYDDMRSLAATGGPKEISQQSFVNRFLITRARVSIGPNRLQKLDGAELFKYGIDKGWTNPQGAAQQELGEITINGDTALAEVTGGGPSAYDFHLESGEWKLDVIAILKSLNVVLKQQVAASNQGEDEYLFALVESLTGRRVTRDVWKVMPR